MKPCAIGYVPPPQKHNGQVFLANLQKFNPGIPLLLFSDHPYREPKDIIRIPDPEGLRDEKNKWTLNNALFFTALRIALKQGFTHILYLESDCRVHGDDWAKIIFDEFAQLPQEKTICAGSVVVYNPMNSGPVGARRWAQLVSKNIKKNFLIPTYGFKGAADQTGSSIFVNGALGIYNVEWMKELFDLTKTVQLSRTAFAWDFEIGDRIWKKFGPDSYDHVGQLQTIFSSFGDVLTTEKERLAMLAEGKVRAVHQIKSAISL